MAVVGRYHLVGPSASCHEVKESVLTINRDGSYDQSVTLSTGGIETRMHERWNYDPNTRRIRFSNFLIWTDGSFSVEPSHPAVIILDSQMQCWYGQPK